MKNKFFILLSALLAFNAWGFDDPTEGQPFVPWLWEDQFKPTLERSFDTKGLAILTTGAVSTLIAHQYDDTIRRHNVHGDDRFFDKKSANLGGSIGSGGPGIALALAQIYFDTENGLQHSRALALTAANHIALAGLINRQRPNERDYLSMPSGHASSIFATATSLAYSYGWKIGVPAYFVASYVAATRVSENIHWLSDVTAGAAIGIYWGRASALVTSRRSRSMPAVMPFPTKDGGVITASWEF